MKTTIQEKVNHTLDDIRALRDEIRLNIHLAGMDAKDTWKKIEHEIEEGERKATAAGTKASKDFAATLSKVREHAKAFRDRLQS